MGTVTRWPSLAVTLLLALNVQLTAAQSTGVAVDPAKRAAIQRILSTTNAADQMLIAMETAMPAQRAANPLIPDVFWDRFLKRARDKRGEFLEALVPIYDRYFSLADLNELIRFYGSPLGKKLLSATPQIARESILEGQRWGFRIGQEVGEELAREGIGPKN